MDQYDAIIIGAGQAGVPLSTALAGAGWKTSLVEAKYLGGTCINYGCTPTKTMIASAQAATIARKAGAYGIQTGPITVDMKAVRQRKDQVVQNFRSGIQRRLQKAGVEVVSGQARFTGPKTLQ